ncbi:MAG: hypothetical protein DCF15_10885 [Phormidesmis priestleyi]|uniref:histidine kinase n=1 Tax=Phormidesmis priestleyi TaxID=268141 RepID=A0A2W4XLJ4_9CYAN|nr:MAG: hypothetical protein DCF15_10885 [Phormidesmis priestleyi]
MVNDTTPRTSASVSGALSAFVGGGEMGSSVRSHDWRTTTLGPVNAWPQSLRIMVDVILGSSHPMFLMWGPSLTMLYNDGCRSILGNLYPSALGQAGSEVWADAWDTLGPMAQQVMRTGTAAGAHNVQRFVQREGGLVESYYSFSYSPVRDDAGQISGIFCSCSDTTQQVVGDRRLRTLRSLDGILSPIEALPEAARMAIETLASNPQDMPFALLYLVDDNQLARLTSFTGIEPDTAASPLIIDLTQSETHGKNHSETAWPFNQAYHRQEKVVVTNLSERFEDLPTGTAKQSLSSAVIRPLIQPDVEQVIGLLVMAVSPTQPFHEDYQGFFDLVTTHVEKAIINAKVYAAERDRMTALVINDWALREKQQQLDLALRSGRIGTWQLEASTLAFSTSDQCKINYGLPTATDFTYSLLMSRIHPDDQDQVKASLEETLKQPCAQNTDSDHTQYDVEYRTLWDDGSTHWIVSRAYLAYDDAGKPHRLVGIAIDITERKQTEEAIKASEWQFRRVVESNMFGVVFGNTQGQLHYVNNYFAQLLGYSGDQVAAGGVTWQQLTHPDNTAPNQRVLEQLKTEGICAPYEKVLRHADGRRIPTLMAAAMLEEPYDQAEESIGIFLDLTSLKQVTEDRDHFFSLSPDIFAITDEQGYFSYVSSAWETILGFTLSEAKAQPYLSFVHPDDIERTQAAAQRLLAGDRLVSLENRYRHRDNSYRWISWNVIATIGDDIQFYCVGRDITEQKLQEAEREQLLKQEKVAREAAERANRIKDEFLAVVSHELRSPLNPILGWSQLLKRGTLTPEKTAFALETIERNAQLQVQLIGDLLDISRILRGKLSLENKSVDLNAVIAAAIETVRLAAEAKSIQVTLVSEACTVGGDAGRLQQVIWNLLSNAVKFTPANGEVRITTAINGKQAQIEVADTGKGISAEFLPYVFEHFRQEDYSTTRQFGGLGLGLAIARQIIELHGGTAQVDSPGEDQGAKFTVYIPLSVGATMMEADALASPETDLSGLHVLAVDDDADSQEITIFALEQAGAKVSAFMSGADVLAFLQEISSNDLPNVIISDIGMPDMDGYSLMREIRQLSTAQGSQMAAIALTAYAGEIDQQQALAAGFHCHATKPIDPSSLIALIAEQFNKVSQDTSHSAVAPD